MFLQRGKTVSISGAIRNPASFELKKKDNLKSLINIAGNVKSDSKEIIYIYRKAKSNLTVDIENFSSTKLVNGDSIVVPITNEKYKYLSISIDNISRFQIPWLNGISFEDILNSGDLSIENIKKIELVRKLNDDKYESYILNNFDGGQFEFLPYDYLTIQLFKEKNDIGSVVIEGGVNSPGIYPLAGQSETLKSIINRSGGFLPLINMSNVSIKRDTTTFGSIDGEIVLNPLDTIIVNPYNGTINVFGEVNNPGTLEWFENRSIKDYINLSGGLTALGDKKQIVYISPYGNAFKVKGEVT